MLTCVLTESDSCLSDAGALFVAFRGGGGGAAGIVMSKCSDTGRNT